eukprot:snap_masked-scaffold_30-processed-gene-2.15-mRNA-1 protein AED:1.00 eAED:1.00 QI:0/0/0/0/1/1/2/0/344
MNQGFPLVQVQLPSKLTQLTGKEIENFLHEYRNTVRKFPTLSVQSLLSKNVADALEQRGVNIDSSEAILRYLTHHLLNFEKSKRLKCLTRLENDLKWPGSNFDTAEQIYLFFDQVFQIWKHLDVEEIKSHKKKIPRKVIDRIPRESGVQYQEFTLISGERRAMKMDHGMKKIKQRNKRTAVANTLKTSKPPASLNSSNASVLSNTSSHLTINVKRMGDKSRNVSLLLKDVESGKFHSVKGLADTVTDLNVAGLTTMKKFMIREEQPQYIKNGTFMDKKPIPVASVIVTHVVLIQDNWKLDLKGQRFFCVDWNVRDEIIIGDRTLRYFGVNLNLKDVPKAEKIEK